MRARHQPDCGPRLNRFTRVIRLRAGNNRAGGETDDQRCQVALSPGSLGARHGDTATVAGGQKAAGDPADAIEIV